MSYKTNSDNLYKEGTLIRAKARPELQLVIRRYYHRTYYCGVVGDAAKENLTYFEKDLIPPSRLKTTSVNS
jgi:hypothetical protein